MAADRGDTAGQGVERVSGLGLAARCPCRHTAFHHPTLQMQADYRAGSQGRYSGECHGGMASDGEGRACRCIADREAVIASSGEVGQA